MATPKVAKKTTANKAPARAEILMIPVETKLFNTVFQNMEGYIADALWGDDRYWNIIFKLITESGHLDEAVKKAMKSPSFENALLSGMIESINYGDSAVAFAALAKLTDEELVRIVRNSLKPKTVKKVAKKKVVAKKK